MTLLTKKFRSWGYNPGNQQLATCPSWLPANLDDLRKENHCLAYGNGRSYGDSCINLSGVAIDTRYLDKLIGFDVEKGILVAEPGIRLSDVLKVIVPRGWYFPVCPGTSQVTLGGMVSNDVHGKNHHQDGTIGRHILRLTLLRSDGESLACSQAENPEFFSATIGGLGLTGLITSVAIQLVPISSPTVRVKYDLFSGLEEFSSLSQRRKQEFQYTVAWIDCAASKKNFARGVFISANHESGVEIGESSGNQTMVNVPFHFPSSVLNKYSIKAFNYLYYKKHSRLQESTCCQSYNSFFFPLDTINNWNRIYGRNGFHQLQFVVPINRLDVMQDVLAAIVNSGLGSFLSVLKEFGPLESPGLLSFPRPGWCLALDFADRGEKTIKLIRSLHEVIIKSGGAVYPAKDRVMSSETFLQSFPASSQFIELKDKAFTSDFWRRVSDSQ